MPTYDRLQIKSRLATMVSNLKLKMRSGELDKMADEAMTNPAFAEVVMKVDPNNAQALAYIRKGLKRMGFIESEDLIDQVLSGTAVDEVVGELILGVQTPPPDIRRRKTKMGGGVNPESNKSSYYPGEPGSQGWFET
jgi:hypothetical protein